MWWFIDDNVVDVYDDATTTAASDDDDVVIPVGVSVSLESILLVSVPNPIVGYEVGVLVG